MAGQTAGDGDGWVYCQQGHRHWGRFGAAGLLLRRCPEPALSGEVVLQHRAPWTHEGDTWGLPGGARDSHEDPVGTALREAGEEAGIDARAVAPVGVAVAEHGGWSYTTVVADALTAVEPSAANAESVEVRWWPIGEVSGLPLHPGLTATWPGLQTVRQRLTVVVDGANVVGARPDGWWRDRPGAARRLRQRLVDWVRHGIVALPQPAAAAGTGLDVVLPRVVLVLEGAASGVAQERAGSAWYERAVETVAAERDGDARVITEARSAPGPVVVVSADRGLRARLPVTAATVGPRWLDEPGTSM